MSLKLNNASLSLTGSWRGTSATLNLGTPSQSSSSNQSQLFSSSSQQLQAAATNQLQTFSNQPSSSSLFLQQHTQNGAMNSQSVQESYQYACTSLESARQLAEQNYSDMNKRMKEALAPLTLAQQRLSKLLSEDIYTDDHIGRLNLQLDIVDKISKTVAITMQSYNLANSCSDKELVPFQIAKNALNSRFEAHFQALKLVAESMSMIQGQENHDLHQILHKRDQVLKEQAQFFEQGMKIAQFESQERQLEFQRHLDELKENNRHEIAGKTLVLEKYKIKTSAEVENKRTDASITITKINNETQRDVAKIDADVKKHEANTKVDIAEIQADSSKFQAVAGLVTGIGAAAIGGPAGAVASGLSSAALNQTQAPQISLPNAATQKAPAAATKTSAPQISTSKAPVLKTPTSTPTVIKPTVPSQTTAPKIIVKTPQANNSIPNSSAAKESTDSSQQPKLILKSSCPPPAESQATSTNEKGDNNTNKNG